MRPLSIAGTILTVAAISRAQLIDAFNLPSRNPAQSRTMAKNDMPGIQIPISDGNDGDYKPPAPPDGPEQGSVILSDVMGSQKSVGIFAGFARDISSVSDRLDNSDLNTTVLAPLNRAISDLPRKPWEDPREYAALGANAYEGSDGESRAHRNLRRFTEAHVVPESPWREGDKIQTLQGRTIWWERKADGSSVVQPGDVKIEKIASRVANGEVWVLSGVLNYA